MAAPTSMSDLLAKLSGSVGAPELVWFFKGFRMAGATWTIGQVSATYTGWLLDGNSGAAPTTVAAPTGATAGAITVTNATGGRSKYLSYLHIAGGGESSSTLNFYDRLLHIGNLSGTVTTAQTVAGSLTRNTGGVGNFIAAEIYTQIGATATTITASYTNQAGTSGRTTQALTFGGTGYREINRWIVLPLQGGDTGVRSVQSVTVLATTGTAGNFGIVVGNPLLTYNIASDQPSRQRSLTIGTPSLPLIEADSCLTFSFSPSTTSVSSNDYRDLHGLMMLVES